MSNKTEILKQYFGFSAFREGQEQVIDAVSGGRDALAVMPTGGGKSLCYQIPALMAEGITFVISPLISLMKDQVMSLKAAGINAAYINSSLTLPQLLKVYDNLKNGAYKIVYIAPERLDSEGFCNLCQKLDISIVAVDEAHCISQWGQDFRPSYLKISDFIKRLTTRPVIAAFTATATNAVREDIIKSLELKAPLEITTGFDRANLSFEVITPGNKNDKIKELVKERRYKCGIIYCATRKNVEKVYDSLNKLGIMVTKYHAGLSDEERKENQESFIYERAAVMVATNAFGMGINKSNVNYVIHYNMPLSIEAYYQEAGRAGRDGEAAECILLFNQSDIATANILVRSNGQNEELSEQEREELLIKDLHRLNMMIDYCRTTKCLRGCILDYFGEKHEDKCGNCSNCKAKFSMRDITIEAQMILSCVKRAYDYLGYSLGKGMISSILTGSDMKKINDLKLKKLTTYAIMEKSHRREVNELINFLEMEGYLYTDEEHGGLMLTKKASKILFEGEEIEMPFKEEVKLEKKKKREQAKAEKPIAEGDLYETLRALRNSIAQEEKIPPYIIFSNATLADMAAKAPTTEYEFRRVSGVGKVKAEKYGEIFIEKIIGYMSEEREEE